LFTFPWQGESEVINLESSPVRRESIPYAYRHAVVIGSSIAGLTAARVLADHFERVTVVERDRLPEDRDFRKGIPQARHAHILLLRGSTILEELFPGLRAELIAAGAVTVNVGTDVEIRMAGSWLPHFPSDMEAIASSRPLLENAIYGRLKANPRITFRPHGDILRLCPTEDNRAVRGVYLAGRNGHGGPEEMAADLVVDASGRDSKAPEWLAELGFSAPEEVTVNSFPGYATRVYKKPAGFPESFKMMYIMPMPPESKRGGVMLPLEGDAWHVTLVGMAGDHPPTDEAGFLEFARSLPSPRLYEAISQAEPVGPIYGYRRAENRLRRFDSLPRYLEGFVALGDSVFALNPVYGQGMTVAAIASLSLGDCLAEQKRSNRPGLDGLAQRFQAELGKVLAGPWQTATNEDKRWPETKGGQALDAPTRLIQGYISQVMRAMPFSPALTEAFYRVQHMTTPPTLLLRPDMMARVFKTNLARRFSRS
jgi:2-polyprenyl-6-methoxyphenol hydroxylase-like FAD-dependent oxidoreductase